MPVTPYVANTSSRIVHRADCRWVGQMAPHNSVGFARLDNALAEGFRPCRYCLPRAATRPSAP